MSSQVRRGSAKKGICASASRSRRETAALTIRKEKKDENLMKRRNAPVEAWSESKSLELELKDADSSPAYYNFKVEEFPQMVQALLSPDEQVQILNLRGFRKLLSVEVNPPVQECIDCGAVPIIVNFLRNSQTRDILFEAAWALTNIASTNYTEVVLNAGAVPYLVNLLLHIDPDVRDQCAWCLGNIAGDGTEFRDMVLNQPGAMEAMLKNLAQPANLQIMRNCTWTLSNFCRGKPAPPLAQLRPALPALAHLLANSHDTDTTVDACWALSYVSDGDNDRILAVTEQRVIPTLMSMLASDDNKQIVPALRTIGNIVSGDDSCTQAVVDGGFLDIAATLLENSKKNIRKETCWALSNIAAGSIGQLQALMSQGEVLGGIMNSLSSSSEWEVRKEAAWVVNNILTSGNPGHIEVLVQAGVIAPLCDILEVSDSKIITVALEALESILKYGNSTNNMSYAQSIEDCGGMESMENLQEHKSQEIYEKCVELIEVYFQGAEEEENQNIPSVSDNNQYSFGVTPATAKHGSDFDFASNYEQRGVSTPFTFNEM